MTNHAAVFRRAQSLHLQCFTVVFDLIQAAEAVITGLVLVAAPDEQR